MRKRYESQRGIVSFIVTLIMMLVISLIVIGFAQVSRRTQRETLDRQLAAQAQYAAESGVNMVKNQVTAASALPKENCDNASEPYRIADPTLSDGVAVTCVLVNPRPNDIKVSASQDESTIIPIKSSDSLLNLTISWIPADNLAANKDGCGSSVGSFATTAASNCTFALLRVDIVKPAAVNFQSLADNTLTFYLQPMASNASIPPATDITNFNSSPRGRVLGATCSNGENGTCSMTLNFNGSASGSEYYMRLSTIYRDTSSVIITGNGGAVTFTGAQAIIDSTGKAQDVLKRVQVRYPIGITKGEAPYAVQSESTICKRYTVGNNVFQDGCL